MLHIGRTRARITTRYQILEIQKGVVAGGRKREAEIEGTTEEREQVGERSIDDVPGLPRNVERSLCTDALQKTFSAGGKNE